MASAIYNSNTSLSPQVILFLCCNNCFLNLFFKNVRDASECFGNLVPAYVGHDTLRVLSNEEFVNKKGEDEYYIAYGDVSQIWKRQMKSTGRMVAIKGFRMTAPVGVDETNQKFQTALLKLAREWKTLEHNNIMPCLGVTYDFGLIASVVMPLCPEGDINDYVRDHPHANRLNLLTQVASGVVYLHSRGVVHGKICGKNIVVAPNGCPLITDAGLAQVIRSQEGIFPWATPSESLRWQAPETFGPDLDDAYTASSDVWSLAMTILEVMSGRVPYYPRRQIHATAFAIMDGVLPKRPDNDTVSDSLWSVLCTSWAKNPSDRPCAAFVQQQLDAQRAGHLHHLYKL
ncbi:hypothetical protein HWV62_13277 [Athelia sp. TMB]|nr:hypothetical protein HWV62_13277 [Athelia sp. TMB]